MLKHKCLALLVLLGHITTYNTLQSRQVRVKQPVRQVQQPAKTRQQQVRRQTRQQPTRQTRSRQAQQRVVQPIQQPIQQPIPQVQQNIPMAPRLSEFDFGAASVLPTFIDLNGKKYLILSREAGGTDIGTYDDFGGKRDLIGPKNNQKKEAHPVITAAREFFEEAILMLSINFSLQNTKDFIEVNNPQTEFVIAYGHNVTYITDFTAYADTFFANFYNAFNTTISRHSKEKDRIAIVGWDELKTVIHNARFNSGIIMDAQVLNPADQKWYTEKITLRGFFAKKLRPFWMNQPYQQGMSSKIHFY